MSASKTGEPEKDQWTIAMSMSVMQDVAIGGNWVNSVQDLSVLCLTNACESTNI